MMNENWWVQSLNQKLITIAAKPKNCPEKRMSIFSDQEQKFVNCKHCTCVEMNRRIIIICFEIFQIRKYIRASIYF